MPSMKDCFSFCRSNGFDYFNKAIIDKKIEFIGNYDYHFVLVNSAPFSCLEHVDKDFHFIPRNEREICGNPSLGRKTVEILVSHHRPDWFEESSKESLDCFIENVSSICMFGHDHREQYLSVTDGDNSVVVSRGGRLNIQNNQLIGSFSKLIINDNTQQCQSVVYSYSKKYNKFVLDKQKSFQIRLNDCMAYNDSFITSVINPEVVGSINESQAFTFPTLRPNGTQDYIETLDSLLSFINKERKVVLTGYSNSGKSAIMHRVFESFDNKKWRIYLDCSLIQSTNFPRHIRNAFNDQYKYSDTFYNEFMSTSNENKIVLLDNVDRIVDQNIREKLIDYCNSFFGYVVITVNNVDAILFKKSLTELFDANSTFSISGLSIKKRQELYLKICKLKNIDNQHDIDLIISCAEASMKMCNVIDMSDPYYLTVLLENIISRNLYIERNTSDAFSLIFKYSIEKSIVEASSESKLSNIVSVLQQLAFDITFNKKSVYFTPSDLDVAISTRNNKFQNINISFDEVLRILKKSKIVKLSGNKYRFQRNSYIAYFASQEVVRLYQRGEKDYMIEAVNNIVNGINGDVFLFAAYQLKQVDVFFRIQDFLDEILKGFKEIDFKEKNNALLIKNVILRPETKEQQENKQDFYDRIDKTERRKIAKSEKEEDSVYEKEYDKETEAILKAMKMLEISAKAIAGFEIEIEAGERELLIDKTIGSSLKLANLVFSFTENDIEEIRKDFERWKINKIEDMKKNSANVNKIKEFESIDIVHALYDFLVTWLLNLEYYLSEIMTSGSSLSFIAKMNDDSFCRKIFKLMSFSISQKVDSFISYLNEIYDKDNKELRYILDRIVRVFIINNRLDYRNRTKLSSITDIKDNKILLFSGNLKNNL